MKQDRKVFHIEFIEPIDGKRHYYFASKAAIYQYFTRDEVGIGYRSLRNLGSLRDKPYVNNLCTIWQGDLIGTQSNKEDAL